MRVSVGKYARISNDLSYDITQSLHGYGEQGLGGACELANSFLIIRTESVGIAP